MRGEGYFSSTLVLCRSAGEGCECRSGSRHATVVNSTGIEWKESVETE